MNKFKHVEKYLMVLVPVFFTYLITSWFYEKSNEMQYLDVYTEVENEFLNAPYLFGKDSFVSIGKNKSEKLTRINVGIYNFSNTDYTDVPVIISIKDKNNNKLTVFGGVAFGAGDIKDGVKKESIESHYIDNKLFKYTIKVVNRTEKSEPIFKSYIYLKGDVEPDVDVQIQKTGLTKRIYDYENSPAYIKQEKTIIKVLVGVVLFGVGFMILIAMPILSRFFYFFENRVKKIYTKEIYKVMNQHDFLCSFSDSKRKALAIDIIYGHKIMLWDESSLFSKWVDGMRRPNRKDYEFDDEENVDKNILE